MPVAWTSKGGGGSYLEKSEPFRGKWTEKTDRQKPHADLLATGLHILSFCTNVPIFIR